MRYFEYQMKHLKFVFVDRIAINANYSNIANFYEILSDNSVLTGVTLTLTMCN